MERRFRYNTAGNVLECIGFLVGYLLLWIMAGIEVAKGPKKEELITMVVLLFASQLLLLHAVGLVRAFRQQIVLTEDSLICTSPSGKVTIDRTDIVSLENYPHVLGAGFRVVAKDAEITFNRRIGGFKELVSQLRESLRRNQASPASSTKVDR